ncbi:MAG: hypothetical protein JW837_01255 [Sedimentisphaerales bacterium]|nr:hypothetical protein [Sedimentisphaerales bacterium]
MIFPGSITFPASPWLWPAMPVLILVLLLLFWSYRRSVESGTIHKAAFCLRLSGVLVLVICLTEPLWSGRHAKSGANMFLVVADNSSGMNVRDEGKNQSRGEILKSALTDKRDDWLNILADNFQVRQYIFDSRLRRVTDFSEMSFQGKASAIGTVLQRVSERYRDRPLAGVILMTDGNATDMTEQFYNLSSVPAVYPVVIGSTKPLKDLSLTSVSVTQTSFEDAPVMIQAEIQATDYIDKTIIVDLLENSGRLVERQTHKISKKEEKQVFRFRLRPDRTGILFYNLIVRDTLPNEDMYQQNKEPSEATLANNKRTIVVDRGEGPYRILYVTGKPNWEYKFLKRAISEDEQVQLVALLRVAKREPKYDWRGRTGEVNNPLFRGFDGKDGQETGQYDQPVLVRLDTHDERELSDGFPKTREELFKYHAVILDDVEAGFFTFDQMELLEKFVTERGGGFLMLGGKASFQQGDFDRTPVGHILPVYLDRQVRQERLSQAFLNLTREGWLQPWLRLSDNEEDEKQRRLKMPPFRVVNFTRSIKPGARILATVGNSPDKQIPALIIQRYGNGRVAALTVGDVWRWGMKQSQLHKDMDKFWRQTLRWLVADVPDRVTLKVVQKPDEINQPVVLQVHARNKEFEPMDNVSVSVEVREPQGKNVRLTAEAVFNQSGLFEATYIPRTNGGYFADAVITDSNGFELGKASTGWVVDLEANEFRSIGINRSLLEKLANQTKGSVVELEELGNFVDNLPNRTAPIMDTWVKPFWDLPGILPAAFMFILICFAGEWTLRRWKGMP